MFKCLPMLHLTLYLIREDVPDVALVLARWGVFAPQKNELSLDVEREQLALKYKQYYASAERRLDKIIRFTQMTVDFDTTRASVTPATESELERLDEELGRIWNAFSGCEEAQRRLAQEQQQLEQLAQSLDDYEVLDVNLGLLQAKQRFMDVHIGTMASQNVARLRDAVALHGYTLTLFKETDSTAHVVLAGLAAQDLDLQSVLRAASFQHLSLPPEFQDRPDRLRADLASRQNRIDKERRLHQQMVAQNKQKFRAQVQHAAQRLAFAEPYYQLIDRLQGRDVLVRFSGWVLADHVAKLRADLQHCLQNRLEIELREPTAEELTEVPSAFHYSRWMLPFANLVRGYGIPRYNEIDPTFLFALTFVAMFGMMFGDVGHGGIITLTGLLLSGKWRTYMPFVVAIGLSSMGFGFLYGSVMGHEGMIEPMWMSPLSDPQLLLRLALYWGIGFILLASVITVRNRLVARHYIDACFDAGGLVGIFFYLGLLHAGFRMLIQDGLGIGSVLAIVLPLLVIMVRIWQKNKAAIGERVLIVLVEGFETVMRAISNTLSFLRVAAFSLNHAALAVAVLMIAEAMNPAGHWLTLFFGNIFSLVLEGGIVAIQVLRLEYYEGFSRFFTGDGKEFQPLRLRTER